MRNDLSTQQALEILRHIPPLMREALGMVDAPARSPQAAQKHHFEQLCRERSRVAQEFGQETEWRQRAAASAELSALLEQEQLGSATEPAGASGERGSSVMENMINLGFRTMFKKPERPRAMSAVLRGSSAKPISLSSG